VVIGEQGTAKSYACQMARRCIDPSQANLSLTPKEPRDLLIAARNSHVLGFDNLSYIPDWLSDVLCSISTGAGFRTRTLTTDSTETIFAAAKPIVLNSIAEIVRRGDLMDRAVTVSLAPIPEEKRRTEAEVDALFTETQPEILAGLADAVVQALRERVTLVRLPRMADFAVTVESAAPALGWRPGEFLEVYAESRAEAAESLLEGDLVVSALRRIHESDQARPWEGTSEELRERLVHFTAEGRREALPKTVQSMVGQLRRIAPLLRKIGIDIELPKLKRVPGAKDPKRLMRISYPGAQAALRFAREEGER
jgi:hypothetical protein